MQPSRLWIEGPDTELTPNTQCEVLGPNVLTACEAACKANIPCLSLASRQAGGKLDKVWRRSPRPEGLLQAGGADRSSCTHPLKEGILEKRLDFGDR